MAGKRAQISCPFAPYLATIAKLWPISVAC
jgi:hypothetical protein